MYGAFIEWYCHRKTVVRREKPFPLPHYPFFLQKGPEYKLTCLYIFHCCYIFVLIQKTWVCDGIHDCSRGEDESKCETKCEENQFRCGNVSSYNSTTVISKSAVSCIGKKHVCDGKRDCPKGEGKKRNNHRSVTASQTLRMWCLFQSQCSSCPLGFNIGGHANSILVFQGIFWKPLIFRLCWDNLFQKSDSNTGILVLCFRLYGTWNNTFHKMYLFLSSDPVS